MSAASVGVSYPALPDRVARGAYALGAVGLAYLDALARSDWVGATGLLTLFQELYNENRISTLIGFAAADQLEANRLLPQSVSTSGRFDGGTRTALVGALVSGLGVSPALADSMPSMAAGLGRWFVQNIVPAVPPTAPPGSKADFAWDIARVAESADMAQAAFDVRGAVLPFITGGASAVDAPLAVDVANAKARQLVEQSGGTQSTRAVERGAGIDNPTGAPLQTFFQMAPMLVTAERPKFQADWLVWAIGAGVVAFGGIIGYQIWRVKGGRGRR